MKLIPVAQKEDTLPKSISLAAAESLKSKSREIAMQGLSMLGFDSKYTSTTPRATAFPSKFHPDSRPHWDSLFSDNEFKSTLKSCRDPVEQWQVTIRRFMSRCSENNCDPFAEYIPRQTETPLYRYLSSARSRICKYMDTIRLFEVVKFSDVVRKYVRSENNFEVQVSAKITGFGPIENLTTYLLKSGFRRNGDLLIAMIDGATCIKVDVSRPSNVRLCYEIRVASALKHPKEGIVKLKNKQYDDYVSKNIWLPIVRAIRFSTMKRKALF